MKITKDITRHITFAASQEILFWLGEEMAKYETAADGTEERGRWKSLFDCMDFVEKWRYDKEFEVSDVTERKITKVDPKLGER